MLINIPGTKEWVNPKYVTNVYQLNKFETEIYVVAKGGYGTKWIKTKTPADEVADLINGDAAKKDELLILEACKEMLDTLQSHLIHFKWGRAMVTIRPYSTKDK